MSVHSNAGSLPTAALVAKVQHGLLHAGINIYGRHDELHTNDLFATNVGKQSEAVVPVFQVVDVSSPRNIKFRHNSRLDKPMLHDFPRLGLVVDFAQVEGKQSRAYSTSKCSRNNYSKTQIVRRRGKFVHIETFWNLNSAVGAYFTPVSRTVAQANHLSGPVLISGLSSSLPAREADKVAGTHSLSSHCSLPRIAAKAERAIWATSPTRSATLSPGPPSLVDSGGKPSTPSPEADSAKMEERGNAQPDRAAPAGSHRVNSGQAANQFEVSL